MSKELDAEMGKLIQYGGRRAGKTATELMALADALPERERAILVEEMQSNGLLAEEEEE